MRKQAARQVFLLILGAFVALGISMSTVASSDMAIGAIKTIAMVDEMASVDCQDSGKGEPCMTDMQSCALVCAGLLLALPPPATSLPQAVLARDFVQLAAKSLVGTGPPPDLSPPRTTHIV